MNWTLDANERKAVAFCGKYPRGFEGKLYLADALASLERKGLAYSVNKDGKALFFLTEDGRKELKRG